MFNEVRIPENGNISCALKEPYKLIFSGDRSLHDVSDTPEKAFLYRHNTVSSDPMEPKKNMLLQHLAMILVLNTLMLVAIYFGTDSALAGREVTVFGLGFLVSIVLWVGIRTLTDRLTTEVAPSPATPAFPPQPSGASALQLLSILQRKGRLIDFLQEDLHAYDDAQIGAAVRTVHAGCKEALDAYVALAPVYEEAEGTAVTIAPGFDPQAVRLTGDIAGDPPFHGALRHRGWRVEKLNLPQLMHTQDKVIAAAEVEVEGA